MLDGCRDWVHVAVFATIIAGMVDESSIHIT
jgi:hypothetical protein